MAKNKSSTSRDKIAEAALRLAAVKGWEKVTLEQIAKAAKISSAKMLDLFANKEAVIAAIIERTDAQMEKAMAKNKPEGAPRERLFDIIMARFDVLQKDRKGVIAILSTTRKNPAPATAAIPAMARSIKKILQLADVDTHARTLPVQLAGLSAIYALTLSTWLRDETRDISKTMAMLDRLLTNAERVMKLINTRK